MTGSRFDPHTADESYSTATFSESRRRTNGKPRQRASPRLTFEIPGVMPEMGHGDKFRLPGRISRCHGMLLMLVALFCVPVAVWRWGVFARQPHWDLRRPFVSLASDGAGAANHVVPRKHGGPEALIEFSRSGIYLPVAQAIRLDLPVHPREQQSCALVSACGTSHRAREGPKRALGDSTRALREQLDVAQDVGAQDAARVDEMSHERDVAQGIPALAPQARDAETVLTDAGDLLSPPLSSEDRVRLLVAILSVVGSDSARRKRDAIRTTWMRLGSTLPNVDLKFIVAQPPRDLDADLLAREIGEEVAVHADMVMVRGEESYGALPDKVFRTMEFALSLDGPARYTHVLKTDDDTYVRVERVLRAISGEGLAEEAGGSVPGQPLPPPRMSGLYMGCLENRLGFIPIRSPQSKWYVSHEELPDSEVPWGQKYLAGWGYVLSRDLVKHVLRVRASFDADPASAPVWYSLRWEDVLVGLMIATDARTGEMRGAPFVDHPGFKAAWRGCANSTIVKHLDIDSPMLTRGLYEQDISGLWDVKPVQCSTGPFLPGDYSAWKLWRNSLVAEPI